MSGYTYETNCVTCPGPDPGQIIGDLIDSGRQVTRRTFLRYVDRSSLAEVEASLGYAPSGSRDLTMRKDWHVSYNLGQFRGKPCAFFQWSAIEYIFTEEQV